MPRYERFTFLCDSCERRAITNLAARLQRSQSDAVRFVVSEVARQLNYADADFIAIQDAGDPKQNKWGTHVTG
jgi:hypothetical protein